MSVAEWRAKDRLLPSWIDGFVLFTESIQSPEIFRKWAAISAVAGALEQKVWVRSQRRNLYPNLYTFLVGPPGVGKTQAIEVCESLWRTLDTHKIAEVSLTKAALVDRLAESVRIIRHPAEMTFNSLLIASKELGALIPQYDPDFLNALTYFYDCLKYDEKRRTAKDGPLTIEHPQINLVAATTPSYLVNTMPPGAWEQGFLSRVILVYSDLTDIRPLNLMDIELNAHDSMASALTADMKVIGQRIGRIKFTEPAVKLIEEWHKGGCEPKPSHPRLINYNTRRIVHLLKLCMVSCADRGADNIDVIDFQRAQGWLFEAEFNMPDVFVAMMSGGDAVIINECWHYVITYNARNAGPAPVHLVYQFLQGRAPASAIEKIYSTMLNSGMIKVVTTKGGPGVLAKPR